MRFSSYLAPWPEWPKDYKWSHSGKIPDMQCMQIFESEEQESQSWRDNYLCWNKSSALRNPGIQWSERGEF